MPQDSSSIRDADGNQLLSDAEDGVTLNQTEKAEGSTEVIGTGSEGDTRQPIGRASSVIPDNLDISKQI